MSENRIQAAAGTPWREWQQSAHLARARWLKPEQLCPPGRRLVLLAPTRTMKSSWPADCWPVSMGASRTCC